MPIRVDLSEFFREVRRISDRVVEIDIRLGQEAMAPIEVELLEGKEVALDELEIINGLLAFEGRQVLLYIPDHGPNVLLARDVPEKGRRFHVADCTTLDEMKAQRRFERYVATNRLDGGFKIHGVPQGSAVTVHFDDVPLKVCMNCLKRLNYRNYRNERRAKAEIWVPFSIADFFATYSTSFSKLPGRSAGITSGGGYTPDWPQVSSALRRKRDFTCEQCRVNLSSAVHALHVHHVNGVKDDNSEENLEVLCADCHRKQPMHDNMFVRREDMAVITRLRREQGIESSGWENVLKLADASVFGALAHARATNWPEPVIGYEIPGPDDRVIGEVEVAWPQKRVAIYLGQKPDVKGWELMLPSEFLGKE